MNEKGYVYFVQCGDLIKIGFSAKPERRVRTLRRQFEGAECIGLATNETITEFDAHQRFAHLRQDGEWFTAAPELLEFIQALPLISEPIRLPVPKVEPTEIDRLLELRNAHRGNVAVVNRINTIVRCLKWIKDIETMPEWQACHVRTSLRNATIELAQLKADGWQYIEANHRANGNAHNMALFNQTFGLSGAA